MSNKKRGLTVTGNTISGTVDEITNALKNATSKLHRKIDPNERDYEITGATIKDMLCNYDLVITGEVCHGWHNSEKGQGIVDKDMLDAMARFNVHLACLDDAFKTANIQYQTENGMTEFNVDGNILGNIDALRSHSLTHNYVVTGFKVKGGKGNESVVLLGTKYVSMAGDHMELQTPRIPLDQTSSYTWHNELSEVCELIKEEVALYREGKYTDKEPKEPKDKAGSMFDGEQEPLGDHLDKLLEGTTGNDSSEQF